MSDTIEQVETDTVDPGTLTEQEQTVADLAPATEEKPAKAPRAVKEPVAPHPCACSHFLYGDKEALDDLFTPECNQTTQRVFAQGHDARLVSTLVQAQFDGYQIFMKNGEGELVGPFDNAAHAVSGISEPLFKKAEQAISNAAAKEAAKAEKRQAREAKQAERRAEADKKRAAAVAAKEAKKAEKEAAKAAEQPKKVAATVVEGSQTGDAVPVRNEILKIKVGRWEYEATNNDNGTLTYRDSQGVEQTRNLDEVRILTN